MGMRVFYGKRRTNARLVHPNSCGDPTVTSAVTGDRGAHSPAGADLERGVRLERALRDHEAVRAREPGRSDGGRRDELDATTERAQPLQGHRGVGSSDRAWLIGLAEVEARAIRTDLELRKADATT